MNLYRLVVLLELLVLVAARIDDPDQHRNLEQLIESRGFQLQSHFVTTEDGYILEIHHVVNPNQNGTLKPVILQHGLIGSSNDFFTNSPHLHNNNSKYGDTLGFALMLTNRYDVWAPNARGNYYSNRHEIYSTEDQEYWEFTFEHMALYDIPASVEYVKQQTGAQQVAYIGYSQGNTAMFALLALKPQYTKVIRPFISLAPVAFAGNIQSPLKVFAAVSPIVRAFGGEFLITSKFSTTLLDRFCVGPIKLLCATNLMLLGGYNTELFNTTRLKVYFHFMPSGTSNWNIAHWSQLVLTNRFIRFNYGSLTKNYKAYGKLFPPDYPLEKIGPDVRLVFFVGEGDTFATHADIHQLKRKLKNANIEEYIVPDKNWGHVDFALGGESGKMFIDHLVNVLDRET